MTVCLCGVLAVAAYFLIPRFLVTNQPVVIANEPRQQHNPTQTPSPMGIISPQSSNTETVISRTPTMTLEPSLTPTITVTPRPEGRPFVGELAPEFTLLDANTGEAITLSHFTGQPVMVNFWATWCGFCEDEMPFMQSAYEQRQNEGLVILAVDYEDVRADVVEYGQSHNLTFHLLLDEDGEVADDLYRVTGFPTSFFIYPDGIIAFIQIGSMTSEQLNQQLDLIMSR